MIKFRLLTAATLALCALAAPSRAQDDAMFPFPIGQGAPDNITNVQTWSGAAPVAGSQGFVTPALGEFQLEGKRARFLGTNLCFTANFPSHEKAERVAASLSRFGISVVRLHHMDSRHIWGKNFDRTTTEIDPEQLEKLDYLIYQLHRRGIYVNINLHVSRAFKEHDGFPEADKLPTQNKGVDNFDARMIELQKKYAKDLLQHVNPYTKKAYVDDPGVAVIEINNENSIVASWSWGNLDSLPEHYATEFRGLWNEWLTKKYGTTAKLREAWNCRSYPLGENQIPDGIFTQDTNLKGSWHAETDPDTVFTFELEPPAKSGLDSYALHAVIGKVGQVSWRPQFHRSDLRIEKGKPYTLSYKYRSSTGGAFKSGIVEDHDPWAWVGFSKTLEGTKEWQTFTATFIATQTDDHIRATFSAFQDGTDLEIADATFREGGNVGIDESETLESKSVPVPRHSGDGALLGAKATADFSDFLHDLEDGYWQDMFKYVKGLGAKQPVTGTQLQYGFWYNQGRLDYCDIHAYWNHPSFPRRQWDGEDWLVTNTALANSPQNGTLANLASARVVGRPYTCSEYDHPCPNFWCAEGNVMLAAVAAFQDWSATFQFAWSHSDDFERQAAANFFDESTQPVKIAHLPACWAVFVRGDVKSGPGKFAYVPKMTEEKEKDIMKDSLTGYHRSIAAGLDLDKSLSLAVYSGIELTDLNLPKSKALESAKLVSGWSDLPESFGSPEKKEIVNEFGEIRWNYSVKDKGWFAVDTANTRIFSGFVAEPREFDGMTLDVTSAKLGWATVSLVKGTNAAKNAEKTGKLSSGRWLLTATGEMRNTDAVMIKTQDGKVTTANHFGGSSGKAPVLCEGIGAKLTLKGLDANSVEVYALTNSGDRAQKIEVKAYDAGAVLEIGPQYKTIWYEIVVK